MLSGPKFARVSYVLFSIAIMAALLKLGGLSGAKPFILRTTPATPVAKAEEPARENLVDTSLDLPERRYTLGGRLPGIAGIPDERESEKPVFYRPSPARDSGGPVCDDLGDFPKSSRVVFPLSKDYFGSYEDTWGAARPQGGHEGTDLMSPAGTPEFAITDGTIVPVSGANADGWNRLGGYTVMLKAAYDVGPIRKGDLFYYAHLDEKSALPIGTKVRAGEQVGYAGDTGEGREGTRGKFPPHLHLGWYDTGSAGDRTDLESGAMNPYPLLLWLEEHGGAVSGGTDAAYCEAPQDPEPDEDSSSGRTDPDLDTGNVNDARPSPVVEEGTHDHSPEPQSKPDEKKKPEKAGKQTKAQSKNAVSASEPDKQDDVENTNNETSTPDKDRTSLPAVEDGSSRAKIEEKTGPLSDPLLRSDRVLQPSHAEKDGARQDTEPPVGKEGQDPPNPSEGKERKNRTRPNSCSLPEESGKENLARVARPQTPIKREEWLAVVRNTPDMRACEADGSDETSGHKALAVWTGHPDDVKVRFYLRGGKIVAENPDEPTIEKMRKIADALGARVRYDGSEK